MTEVLVSVKPKNVAEGSGPPPPFALLTVRVRVRVAVCFGEEVSEACTVILNWPVRTVVPDIDPPDCNAIPAGSVPEVRVQL